MQFLYFTIHTIDVVLEAFIPMVIQENRSMHFSMVSTYNLYQILCNIIANTMFNGQTNVQKNPISELLKTGTLP